MPMHIRWQRRSWIGALLLGLTVVCTARGHDLWLIPPIMARAGQTVTVHANSGMDFPNSGHAPDPASFRRRVVILPDGTKGELDVAGKEDKSGVLRFKPAIPGIYIVAVETVPKLITLDADKFNEYLVTDGLSHIYRLRQREKSLNQPGRERYSKSPKALVRVEGGTKGDSCAVVGLPLEIVPLRDPFQLKAGETLPIRVLFQNRPLADANVGWQHPGDGDTPRGSVRTNGKGEALIPIHRTGLMTLRLTHMTRPQKAEHEWESFWTTLTFVIPVPS